MTKKNNNWPVWKRDDKTIVSCTEKIKVMGDNFDEIQQIIQDGNVVMAKLSLYVLPGF